ATPPEEGNKNTVIPHMMRRFITIPTVIPHSDAESHQDAYCDCRSLFAIAMNTTPSPQVETH
ncbi:MAG TPA: hypothetical protein PLU27_12050, partial [Ginsengibacter sp.]|nr:hypothetical protein [Ginsengibacter sp.]